MTPTPLAPRKASALKRFVAKILDELILIAILAPFIGLFGQSAITTLLLFTVPIAYHALTHASAQQATAGEAIMQLYVTTESGAPLTRRLALERALAYSIPTFPAFTSLGQENITTLFAFLVTVWYAPILLSDRARGVHDMLCGTKVVAGRAKG
jgi:uncharacterized RDD family membrane protein YckC